MHQKLFFEKKRSNNKNILTKDWFCQRMLKLDCESLKKKKNLNKFMCQYVYEKYDVTGVTKCLTSS